MFQDCNKKFNHSRKYIKLVVYKVDYSTAISIGNLL